MKFGNSVFSSLLAAAVGLAAPTFVGTAAADYDSHPEIAPSSRCVDKNGVEFGYHLPNPYEAGRPDPIHCQRLTWDLPATTVVGTVVVSAPFYEDPIPRFPRGISDRVPPMYVDADGNGYERNGDGRTKLCPVGELGWWRPLTDDQNRPITGTVGETLEFDFDGDGSAETFTVSGSNPDGTPYHAVNDPTQLQHGPLFRVECQRGTRAYLGPWQGGDFEQIFDRLTNEQWMRFENTELLDRDAAEWEAMGNDPADFERVEWNTFSEYYNHFGSHHATCYLPNTAGGEYAACNDPNNPQPREAFQPGGACWKYDQISADPATCTGDDASNCGACYSEDESPACNGAPGNGSFRNATQVPGRLSVYLPEGRGVKTVEDQIWRCNHHTVLQLPSGSYSMDKLADFRKMKGGLELKKNLTSGWKEGGPHITDDNVGIGNPIGGTVGEIIIQHFSKANFEDVKPLNTMFNAVPDAVTTIYPPFTWNYHTSLWTPPYDIFVGTMAIHSHHRMVKGTMDILPVNPVRLNSYDVNCGGAAGGDIPTNLYTNWEWEDARVCQFWQDPDGPVLVRKGEQIATTCFVNNGVTPEAIKHGLVAGSMVETLKALGAPIPDYPELVPASSWGDALAESPVGDQLLYGTHPPINYRVVYKCATNGIGSSMLNAPQVANHAPCTPNPAVDADGDYIDGPYRNGDQCGTDASGEGNFCEPSTIIFACVGEDEMCIGVSLYWAVPRLGSEDSHDEAMQNLQEGNVNEVGTPGATRNTDLLGACDDCPAVVGR